MNAPFVQLGTRIPEGLRHAIRVYCVESRVTVENFVAQALAERMERVASAGTQRGHARAARR